MADITITCPHCGVTSKVSEYASSPVPCPACKRPVDKPIQQRSVELQIKAVAAEVQQPLSDVGEMHKDRYANVRERQEKRRRQSRMNRHVEAALSWLAFILVAGLLVAWQHAGRSDPRLLQAYLLVRWLAAGAIWVAVVLAAFADNKLQGILTLFVPAYIVYFALNRLDYFLLRSLFFAVLCALLVEFYLIPENTVLDIVSQYIASWIDCGHRWISKMGHKATDV